MIWRATSAAHRNPRRSNSISKVVLPEPGPPLITINFEAATPALTTTDSSPQSTHRPSTPAADNPSRCRPPQNFPHSSIPADAAMSPPALWGEPAVGLFAVE